MGNKWYNYQFDKPEGMSRVFGPLTRYKFYNTQSPDSQELNFEDVNIPAWKYVSSMYSACQKAYNFDFMRGDMAHVQPRASGIPEIITPYYDPLKFIKNEIVNSGVPYFGFFAETFLAPPNQMGYGDETIHLEAIEADSTLGDLQGSVVGSGEFRQKLNTYIELLKTRSCLSISAICWLVRSVGFFTGMADVSSYTLIATNMQHRNEPVRKCFTFGSQNVRIEPWNSNSILNQAASKRKTQPHN
jgi:hypothetical protein